MISSSSLSPFSSDIELATTGSSPALGKESAAPAGSWKVSSDGHFIGHDGFIVPASFAEFYERFPQHVRNFVRRTMIRSDAEDRNDRENDLLLHLMGLPENSKYRAGGANGRVYGCTDRIQTFDPQRTGGASIALFLAFVNLILINCHISLVHREQSNPLCRVTTMGITMGETEAPDYVNDEYLDENMIRANPEKIACSVQIERGIQVNDFISFLREHSPEVEPVFKAILNSGTYLEAQIDTGMSEQMFTRSRNRIHQLLACFQTGAEVPQQRRIYRARTKPNSARKTAQVVQNPARDMELATA